MQDARSRVLGEKFDKLGNALNGYLVIAVGPVLETNRREI